MAKLTKTILAAATLAVAASTTLPVNAGSGLPTAATAIKPELRKAMKQQQRYVFYKFDCAVAGTPIEFPDDVKIWETTGKTVPAGTKIKWTVKAGNGQIVKSGQHTLAAPLGAGKVAFLSNVLPFAMPAGKEACKAS